MYYNTCTIITIIWYNNVENYEHCYGVTMDSHLGKK